MKFLKSINSTKSEIISEISTESSTSTSITAPQISRIDVVSMLQAIEHRATYVVLGRRQKVTVTDTVGPTTTTSTRSSSSTKIYKMLESVQFRKISGPASDTHSLELSRVLDPQSGRLDLANLLWGIRTH